jgi:DNA-binding MarR family transcriptional regulator
MSRNGSRAWHAMVSLVRSQKRRMAAALMEFDLTEPLAHAIGVIPSEGVTMRTLADELQCDPANATGLVDRLEERGLIERRLDPQDRRVRRVFLTLPGRRMRERVEECFFEPPPAIRALSGSSQRTLREILECALRCVEDERLQQPASADRAFGGV